MASTATILAAIDTAIEALLNGGASSYSINNRTVTKLDLGELLKQRRDLQNQVDRETNGIFRLAKMSRTSQ
jgi:flagellar basal body rod protein FlgF